jgi:hypothetical protein
MRCQLRLTLIRPSHALATHAPRTRQAAKRRPEDGLVKGQVRCPQGGLVVATWANGSMLSRGLRYSTDVLGAMPAAAEAGQEGGGEGWQQQ